jgi:hypothetical protein
MFTAAPAAIALIVAQVAGCGGDSSEAVGNADASLPDTGMEMPPADGGSAPDGGSPEASTEVDADAANPVEAGVDAGDSAACPFAVPTADEFLNTVANTACASLKGCCNTGANFDTAGCLSFFGNPTFGGFLGVSLVAPYLDGGRVVYDPVSACQCLQGVTAVNCGLIPQDTLGPLQASCIAAFHGTVSPVDDLDAGDAGDASLTASDAAAFACASSHECVSGSFCTVNAASDPTDASLGTCKNLLSEGGACTREDQCSYLGNGTPSLHCSGTCVPRLDAGAVCPSNATCQSNVCANSGTMQTCANGEVFSTPAACSFFLLPDAGPDAGDGG